MRRIRQFLQIRGQSVLVGLKPSRFGRKRGYLIQVSQQVQVSSGDVVLIDGPMGLFRLGTKNLLVRECSQKENLVAQVLEMRLIGQLVEGVKSFSENTVAGVAVFFE